MKNQIKNTVNSIFEEVLAHRVHLHKHPELSFEEFETMEYVSKVLTDLDIPHKKGVAGTGVIGFIRGRFTEKDTHIALRADLDALPIQEQNAVDYKSKVDGVMHACGHDVHTSILLGVAKVLKLNEADLKRPVQLIFQPGEEKAPGGASLLIKEGVLKEVPLSQIYALHVYPEMEAGKVGFRKGLYMASCDEIHLKIKGKGGHAALPHNCIDPILVGAEIVRSLPSSLIKKGNPRIPTVLSFGHFEALGATNVIPDEAIIKGTFRTMDEEWREEALSFIQNFIKSTALKYGAEAELNIVRGYPFLKNDEETTENLKIKAEDQLGKEKVEELDIRLTAEDFSFYTHHVPACFFRLGVRNEGKGIVHGVHHPKFDIDPNSLKTGMEVLATTALI